MSATATAHSCLVPCATRAWSPRPRNSTAKQIVKPLYDALGTRIHVGGSKDVDAVLAGALPEVGLPADFARYADVMNSTPQMRASHFDGIGRVGQDVGTPVIAVNGVAFFGPVISPAPKGDQALALWDGVVAAGELRRVLRAQALPHPGADLRLREP